MQQGFTSWMNKRWLIPTALTLLVAILAVDWYWSITNKAPAVTEQASNLSGNVADNEAHTMPWRQGIAQRYRVLTDSSMQMQATAPGASSIRVQLQGYLDTLTLQVDNNAALLGMRLSSIELKINDTMNDAANRALTTPFRVRFSVNGMPQAFEFPAEVDQQNRSILENLVRSFQLSLENGTRWTAEETNGSGTYQAVYHHTATGQFEKSKRKFTHTATGMVNWVEISSSEYFTIKPSASWITEMKLEETLRSDGQGSPAMHVSNHASLTLVPDAQLTLSPALWNFDAVAAADTLSAITQPVPDISPQEARRRILASIPELDATTRGRLGLIHKLRDLLRVDASLPPLILDALKTQQLSDRTRADLYLALELAGTTSAQRALVEVMSDESWQLKDGIRAIVALGGVKQPATETISALWQLQQSSSGGERQRLASTATLALGSIGNTLKQNDAPEYASLRSTLLSNALGAGYANQRSTSIRALGNTHDATLANDVVILLNDTEPTIRQAAALSLGTLGTDQVADRLVSHYREEDNGYVRGAIAESLQSWTSPTDAAMAMFRQRVRSEVDETTRYNITVLLGNNLNQFPENEAVLRDIIRHEPSQRIRQQAANALSRLQVRP